MPYHLELDRVTERWLGKNRLGTTKRGIGPAYADKATRIGLRVQDLLDPKIFATKLQVVLKEKNLVLTRASTAGCRSTRRLSKRNTSRSENGCSRISRTRPCSSSALDHGETVLFEGAQASMLDLDHGTYPFVTSSNPLAGGACAGAGVGPRDIERIIGVTKAYCTSRWFGSVPVRGGSRRCRDTARDG